MCLSNVASTEGKMAAMPGTLDISLEPQLTREQAEEIYKQGKEAIVFGLMEMANRLAKQQSSPSLSTPSGMAAPYQKPAANCQQVDNALQKAYR